MNKAGTQTIETGRLVLRRFRAGDASAMYANWASDPEVTRFLTWPAHSGADVTRTLVDSWIADYADGGCFNWGIEWKETGSLIGNISVVSLDERTEAADIGYCMGRAFWGRGIMSEALRAVIGYLFNTAGVRRITACHDVNNPRSGRVMQKAGMKPEGVFRRAGKNNQGICDVAFYAILPEDREPERRAPASPVSVRFARREDLARVNELRKQVNDLHVAGKPDVFKPGFNEELRNHLFTIWEDPRQEVVVAELNGGVCGFAVLNHITRPENPFMFERDFLDIDEFCVDRDCRRQGAAGAMVRFIRNYAKEKGFRRLELNMWEFNRGALAFYEAAGFSTYRRYMEIYL